MSPSPNRPSARKPLPPPEQPPIETHPGKEEAASDRPTIDDIDLFQVASPPQAADCTVPFDPRCPVLPSRFGQYILEARIDSGGMGVVYKARQPFNSADPSMTRLVALKMILPEKLGSAQVIKRFLTEAHSAAQLEYHPNIVQIHDVGEVNGVPYFSMQYIAGGSLQQIVDEQYVFPPPNIARLVKKVADAVHFAHTEANIIHRDIKPSNILLGRETDSWGEINLDQAGSAGTNSFSRWAPKLTDFGLVRQADSTMTVQGEVIGTPSYMSPEQARGDLDTIGPRSDVYSIGAVLYALLTGHPPFDAPNPQATITRLLNDEPLPPRQTVKGKATPRDLELICLKCLEKDPARRYQTARALVEDLERFESGEPVLAKPVGTMSVVFRKLRRQAWRLAGGLIVLACLAIVAAFVIRDHMAGKERERKERQEYRTAIESIELVKTALNAREGDRGFNPRDWDRQLRHNYDRLKRLLPAPHLEARQGAQVCCELAEGLWEHGHKDHAIKAAEAAQAVCDEIEAHETLTDRDRILRAKARVQLGRIAVEQSHFADANDHYQRAIGDLKSCASRDEGMILIEAEIYHCRGEMYNAKAKRPMAVGEYKKSIDLRKQLTNNRPYSDSSARAYWNDLARGHGYAGDTLLDLGQFDDADRDYHEAEVIRQALHQAFNDPKSRQQLGRSYMNTGLLMLRRDKRADAIDALRKAIDAFEAIVEKTEHSVAAFKADLADASLELAEIFFNPPIATGNMREAETLARRAAGFYGELLKKDPDNSSYWRGTLRAALDLAYCSVESEGAETDKLLNETRRKLTEFEERKEFRENPEVFYLHAVFEAIRGLRSPGGETECLVAVQNQLAMAIKGGFANAEQLRRDGRLRLFRLKKKDELDVMVNDCERKRKGG